jgi:hypothetical protein
MTNAPVTKKEEEENKSINLPAKDSKKDEADKSAPGSDKK